MSNVKVWIAGASGMLGRACVARLERLGVAHVATGRDLDIAERDQVLELAERERPSHIVNAAAYTRVDDAETHADLAFRANALGPEHLGLAARTVGASLLHFSTDYVFDGRASAPYVESAPTAPLGVYGASKLEGERRLHALSGERPFVHVVRTSWLFGEHGKNFVGTVLRLASEREELRIVADQLGRPTYTPDLADAALALAGIGAPAAPFGTYHFANAGAVSWHAFALGIREEAERRGFPLRAQRILPIATSEYPLPAPRPSYSVLDTSLVERTLGVAPRPWQSALADYLASLAAERVR
jgi:dTDP-4-dehydrorhamnose reductase